MPLSITAYINQIVAGQPRKPSPIHDALQAIANWAAAGLVDADIAAAAAIAISKTALGTFTPWTTSVPTWTASVNPSIGNGSIAGRHTQIGKLVTYGVLVDIGSTTTFGSGAWKFSLPVAPNSSALGKFVGVVFANDTGTAFRVGSVFFNSSTELILTHHGDSTGGWGATNPHTWATGDSITFTIVYEAA